MNDRATARAGALRTLRVDAATVALSSGLARVGVRSILLKGPALGRWLYTDGAHRRYGDVDLLVSPADVETAGAALAAQGYHRSAFPAPQGHAISWEPPPATPAQPSLDLHTTFHFVAVPDAVAWEVLSAGTERLRLGSGEVEVLGTPGRALIVALHLALHGRGSGQQREDLDRAIAQAGLQTWAQAATLAQQLGTVDAMTAALRSTPDGASLADQLELPKEVSPVAQLMVQSAPATSHGLLRLLESGSPAMRLRMIAAELVPPRVQMLEHHPRARRGRVGLATSYVLRPFWLLRHLPAGLRAAKRARHGAAGPRPGP